MSYDSIYRSGTSLSATIKQRGCRQPITKQTKIRLDDGGWGVARYILLPDTPMRIAWDLFMFMLVVYYGIGVPMLLGFDDDDTVPAPQHRPQRR